MKASQEISNAEAALMGLLSEGPMYPYQIEREVECRSMRDWTELSMSAIYKLLVGLERRGLVLRENEVSDQNRLRKLYRLGPAGKKALCARLEALLSEPEHMQWQIDIGIYNCDALPRKTVIESLARYRKSLDESIRCYRELLKYLQDCGCPPHRYGIASRPIRLLEAEAAWVDDYVKELGEEA